MSINGAIEKTRSFKEVTSRIGKLAACLILGAAALPQSAHCAAPTYATAALANNPVAFWQLTESGNPTAGTLPANDSSGNGYNGVYGTTSQNAFNGILSPQPPVYQGFTNGQGALQTGATDVNSPVSIPFLNLNTNTVTITMWINPSIGEPASTGLLMNRNGTDTAGFGFGTTVSATTGMAALGYTWNTNAQATWSFNSGLYPVQGNWNFVALVIRTNSATIYLCVIDPNTGQTNLLSAVNAIAHTPESFGGGNIWLGSDVTAGGGVPDAARVFGGQISGAAVYNSALTSDQILALFAAGLGVQGFPPSITQQPQSQYVITGNKAQLKVTGINGTSPISYQWQLNGTNISLLSDSANFTGATSNVLTILSASTKDVGSYQLVLNNTIGTTFSSNATVTLQTTNLVGEWLDGSTGGNNFLDVSGYSTNHGAYFVGSGNYMLSTDVPPGKTGQSLFFFNGDTGLAISNSSTLDAGYDDTFDNRINNGMTVACWAKGWPGNWNPFVSKYGETTPSPFGGWQLRVDAGNHPCWTIRGAGGTTNGVALGTAAGGNPDDMSASSYTFGVDGVWHYYVGTFDAGTGLRNLYVDGVLAASETNTSAYALAAVEHLCIGARDADGSTIASFFPGQIYDVRIYNYPVTATAVQNLYGIIPAKVATQPKSITTFTNTTTQFSIVASGTVPLTYQWQLNGTNISLLADNANFTGANSNVLTILNATALDVGTYHVSVSNLYGGDLSTNVTLTIVPKLLVGEWVNGATSLTDVSGYQAPGTHDGYDLANAGGSYSFTNDVPPGKTGSSLALANDGIGILNSSTADGAYTNTFDDTINNAMTIAFWAKGYPGNWNPFVSKYGDSGVAPTSGWQLRDSGDNLDAAWTIRGAGGTVVKGAAVYGNSEDLRGTIPSNDGQWHCYIGTFNGSTGERNLYIDGALSASETGNHPYTLAADSRVCIGARDAHGTIGNYLTARIYDVRIYNYNISSNEIRLLSYIPDPSITGQPRSGLAYIGGKATLSATIKGTAPLTNHWQISGTNLVDGTYNGTVVVGSTSNVLTLYNLSAGFQGTYTLVVSNSISMTSSSNAVLTLASTAPVPAGNLVGAWLTGAANLADSSGYQPAGTHDGYGVTGAAGTPSSNYTFTVDVPPGAPAGSSLSLNGTVGIAITNSSMLDGAYTNTFDDTISTNGMTVTVWAKGLPGAWNPWVSKYGENGFGFQLRVNGSANTPCWTVRGTGGTEDMSSIIGTVDTGWHFYAGTYSPLTGNRTLYVDGVLAATQTGQGPMSMSPSSHLALGARDGGGNVFGNYFTGKLYGARIYNTELSQAQVNSLIPTALPTLTLQTPVLNKPLISGNQMVLTWSVGTLLQATNLSGPWVSTGATSPYTNIVSTNSPSLFYRVSNP